VNPSVVIPLLSLVAGSLLTFGLESIRHRRARGEEIQDSRRVERAQAYVDFLEAAHEAAHLLGRSTKGCPSPVAGSAESFWLLDSAVTRKLRIIEVVGSDAVVDNARSLRAALGEFRSRVTDPEMTYASEDYWSAYKPVSAARNALINSARSDLQQTA